MYLRVNGVPLYVRGANVIPFHVLPTRASRANLTRLLTAAKRANMNTIRIWSVEGCMRMRGDCGYCACLFSPLHSPTHLLLSAASLKLASPDLPISLPSGVVACTSRTGCTSGVTQTAC